MDDTLPPSAVLYADDHRGVYIPQYFAESIKHSCVTGVSEEDFLILCKGPDHEQYWETWSDVLDRARVTDDEGVEHYLFQDGDLWLVPVDTPPYDEETMRIVAENKANSLDITTPIEMAIDTLFHSYLRDSEGFYLDAERYGYKEKQE